MTPGARVAAAIEILDAYVAGRPIEQVLTTWARNHRFAGSKDRAAIRDHVFDALRRWRSAQSLGGGEDGRAVMIGLLRSQNIAPQSLFTGDGHAPAKLTATEARHDGTLTRAEQLDCPDWLLPHFDQSLAQNSDDILSIMRDRAPVFLRVNQALAHREEAKEILRADGIATREHPLCETALEVTENPRKVSQSKAYLNGLVELQDVASQAVVSFSGVEKGMRVLDFCAGGGGKSLALAAAGAKVVAHDISPARMRDIPARAKRAGCQIDIATRQDLQGLGKFDLVFADAPCTGSGAWRRVPEGKWSLTPDRFAQICKTQREILSSLDPYTQQDGKIAYATCSLFRAENQDQVDGAWMRDRALSHVRSRQFTPLEGGDGFFISLLEHA